MVCKELKRKIDRRDWQVVSRLDFGNFQYESVETVIHFISKCGVNLRELDLSGYKNKISEETLVGIFRRVPNIISLNLRAAHVVMDIKLLSELCHSCPKLECLDLGFLDFERIEFVASSVKFLELKKLSLHKTYVGYGVSTKELSSFFPNLEFVDLWFQAGSLLTFPFIEGKRIREVNFSGEWVANREDLSKFLIENSSHLTSFSARRSLVDLIPEFKLCTRMEKLDLWANSWEAVFAQEELVKVLDSCKNLKELNLTNHQISDKLVQYQKVFDT